LKTKLSNDMKTWLECVKEAATSEGWITGQCFINAQSENTLDVFSVAADIYASQSNSHKPVVVRGGDSENQFVQHVGKYFDYKNVNTAPNTPTEPLATEAQDTGVSEGERCPRCKSVNLVDIDDPYTKCVSCEFSFVGG